MNFDQLKQFIATDMQMSNIKVFHSRRQFQRLNESFKAIRIELVTGRFGKGIQALL
jgi:hypothetical protein